MKKTLLVILSIIGVVSWTSVQAQLINVNFIDGAINVAYAGGDSTPTPPGTTMSGAAVLGSAGDVWNGLGNFNYGAYPNNATYTSGPLNYANGTASGVTLSLSAPQGTYGANSVVWNNFSPFSWATLGDEQTLTGGPYTPYSALFAHCLVANSATAEGSVTLAGLLANQAYELVLYNASDENEAAGRTSTFVVNGVTQTSTYDGVTSTLVNGVDYTVFNTMSDGTGTLVINFGNYIASESDLNGLQLEQIPEPGTLALLASGAILLLGYQRRKALRA